MGITSAIIITLVAVLFSALFSGSEIAYVQSNKVRMEIDASDGGVINGIIRRFSRHEDMFISSLLVGNNIVLVIYGITFSILVNPLLERWLQNEALVLVANTVMSTGVILIAGEFVPKTAFRINPNMAMRLVALPLYLIYIALYPITLLISAISHGLMRLFNIEAESVTTTALTMEQLDDYIEETLDAQPAQQVVDNEVKIFRNAMDFKDTTIGDCMIPRNEIVAVGIDRTTRQELVKKFIATGLSKIVVYKEDIDDVVGYIHVSELFNTEADWTKCLKPVIFTPETMLANKMMRRMLTEKRSLTIVVDEFGGTAGLVTLEDLVEEIFGDIEDEHDKDRHMARELGPGHYEVSGRAEIDTLNELLHTDIPESDDYHTVAGLLLTRLESMPVIGEEYEIDGMKLKVVKMTASKIQLVDIRLPDADDKSAL
ncbi:MAG: hemolysin family protein [Muribaculaceae bacterium]|nr:hemolysin family protein [Muribaculaceae bacterium]